ncbi:hypothetical protein [Nonomuraea basaltis]|uniref:hypothetical protein n=1 Tax=Nonomuraea basaltis TaxID=2495887 RepID=UPI0014865A36|nr:hypothetical protein [Nonomuraea basaltis]
MALDTPEGRCDGDQWHLYWTSREAVIPSGRVPLLQAWQDIDDRERRWATRVACAKDYRLFFSFLWGLRGRGKNWHEAQADALDDCEVWRRCGRRPDWPAGRDESP